MTEMKKTIGMAVCYDTKNFGSQLQVLATVKKTEQLNYAPTIIRYKKKLTLIFAVQTIPRFFNPDFVRNKLAHWEKNRRIQAHPDIAAQVAMRNARFSAFAERYFGHYLLSLIHI